MAQTHDEGGFDTGFTNPQKAGKQAGFALTGNDFHKNSYHRMLLNSPFGRSSVGLGVNSRNPVYSPQVFNYLNPETLNKEENKPSQYDQFIDKAYEAPTVKKDFNQSYQLQTDQDFNQQEFPFAPKSTNSSNDNPFGTNSSQGQSQFQTQSQGSGQTGSFADSSLFTQPKTTLPWESPGQPASFVFDQESMF